MKTTPGGNCIGVVLVDRRRLDAWVKLKGSSEISDRMEENNTAILSSAAHRKLRQLMVLPSWQGVDAPHLF